MLAPTIPVLPVETVHVLREALHNNNNRTRPNALGEAGGGGGGGAAAAEEEEAASSSLAAADTAKRIRREVMTNMDGDQIAKAIIKNKAADEYMHVLAIARRCRYCMEA
jgi:hypothetical protein